LFDHKVYNEYRENKEYNEKPENEFLLDEQLDKY
jgi:hypothetical protein